MPFESNAETAANRQKLAIFFGECPSGAILDWHTIEQRSGVRMNNEGRTLVRRVLYQMKKPYEARKGAGITLAAAANALRIGMSTTDRVVQAAKRGRRNTDILVEKFVNDLPKADQDRLLYTAALFGAIWNCVDDYRKLSQEKKKLTIVGNSARPIMPTLPPP